MSSRASDTGDPGAADERTGSGQSPHGSRTKSAPKGRVRSLERFSDGPLSSFPPEIQRQALINTEEAAAILDVSPLTVSRWRTSGDGPPYRRLPRSNSVRYVLGDVLDFAHSGRVRHTAEERESRDRLQGGVGW